MAVGPTEEKVRAVAEASQPQTPSEVRSFLGLVGFSARFIPDFATTADPLRKLARKGEPFVLGQGAGAVVSEIEESSCKCTSPSLLQ